MIRSFIKTSALAMLWAAQAQHAYTQSFVVDFEDVEIPDGFQSLSKSITPDPEVNIAYEFSANGLIFRGFQAPWNAFSGFDCSQGTDSTDHSYANDYSAIAGGGYDGSSQYAVLYLNQIFPDSPQYTEPVGIQLTTDAPVVLSGVYVTNTTLTYGYIEDNWEHISSFQLRAKGFKDGVFNGEQAVFDLAKKTAEDTILIREWTFFDLEHLGEIDSISFELFSDDITTFTPFYVAFDHFVFKDSSTSSVQDWTVSSNRLNIRPNPTYGPLYIDTDYAGGIQYELYDVLGRKVQVGRVQNDKINLTDVGAGIYLIHFLSEEQRSLGIQKIQKH